MPQRARRLILAGIICIGVVLLVPEPYADRTIWHSLAEWASYRRYLWELRERTVRPSCGWRVVLFCEQLPTPMGPLAQDAAAALKRIDSLRCERWPDSHSEGVRLFCKGSLADTTLALYMDMQGVVDGVDRGWLPKDPRAEYQAQVDQMIASHGPGYLCRQSDALTYTDNVRWQLGPINRGVYLAEGKYVHISELSGPILCHTA